MSKSSTAQVQKTANSDRPSKPYPDFPLCPHASGSWQKKIRGKIYYFGKWGRRVNGKLERLPGDGWKDALDEYNDQKDDLYAGRTPRVRGDGLTVGDLRGRFLTSKSRALDSGEITRRTYVEYKETSNRLIAVFGESRLVSDLAADDFELLRASVAMAWGPVRLCNEIQRVRTMFKYGYEAGLIDKPMRYGPAFVKPSKSVLRKHRAANGSRMLQAANIHAMLGQASAQLKAIFHLGINCGFGNSDCGSLPISAVNLKSGWVTFPRPKTGIQRRCPLWPETIAALKAALAERPEPSSERFQNNFFLTKFGRGWTSETPGDNAVTGETGKILRTLGLHRPGLGFYSIRHTFRTVADGAKDTPAVRLIMGHADGSIDDVYREHIDDARLEAVVAHVHDWLWPIETKSTGTGSTAISGRMPPVAVEYDGRNGRVLRLFQDAYAGRRFYVSMDKQGKNPAVKKVEG